LLIRRYRRVRVDHTGQATPRIEADVPRLAGRREVGPGSSPGRGPGGDFLTVS
jgi:hypothetical protein